MSENSTTAEEQSLTIENLNERLKSCEDKWRNILTAGMVSILGALLLAAVFLFRHALSF